MNDKTKEGLVDPTGRHSLDEKHAAVALPAGSFDIEALSKGLNGAVNGAAAKRDEARDDAIAKARALETKDGEKIVEFDPALIPGYKVEKVEHAELGIVENVRVYDGGDKGKDEPAADAAGSVKG